ncbi:sugar ABC transporter ATP-binding protein [Vallitalea guaymasensis]|uniref:Sugar ABC transporter ATP-binding protein n=1 Tax=Vallitalea guaymasensis TaxID=1185412 RepID=A0A8J8MDC0_9FIRM|nr:sugar ABC transporter ATP-binding protein [Vallitalea guaymasensis]QUH30831.1 sugar ABC transporter ATP-binding protein [Vallitalea guaymasensis]
MEDSLVLMEGIDKSFPGVKALDNCKFQLLKGEIHALIGENGAGKSTLMKILTGVYKKDAGRIFYKGEEINITNPRMARDLGISIIHQELNLMPDLTVAQNIFIGKEPKKCLNLFLDNKEINDKASELLNQMNLSISPEEKVENLSVAKQQMVEIAKALSYNSDVLIMDEPTAALTELEIEELFSIIKELKEKGVGIVYISHRMEELKQICDRVTVMRDGSYIDTKNMNEVTIDKIINMMVGRELYVSAPEEITHSDEVVLEVNNLNQGNKVKDVSFKLKKGEILGFAGLMGAGRTEVARAIFGADKRDSGEILLNNKKIQIKSPKDAVKNGIGYLSEDRKRYGLVLGLDIETNVVMANFSDYINPIGFVKTGKTSKSATESVKELAIKTPGISQEVKNLSGGNQQKVVIGKWLTRDCDILIFDEPTRGIDIGAKGEIYKLLNELASQGKSIIMISSELPEVLRMSHRIIVMCEGRITGELSNEEATQEKIMQYATAR